uniref:Uncharacterized protein n=1 Tax=Octopus bimaculoides TaxID=37653 RepID=A0A0L8H0L7_OCTBM
MNLLHLLFRIKRKNLHFLNGHKYRKKFFNTLKKSIRIKFSFSSFFIVLHKQHQNLKF